MNWPRENLAYGPPGERVFTLFYRRQAVQEVVLRWVWDYLRVVCAKEMMPFFPQHVALNPFYGFWN